MNMISRKNPSRNCFAVFAALAVFVAGSLTGAVNLYAKEIHNFYDRQAVSLDKHQGHDGDRIPVEKAAADKGPPAEKASSGLWRTHLWESIPADSLKGPSPDIVSEAYQRTDWKPFFIGAQFQLNDGGRLLVHRLNALESEAIDPKPFKLEALAKSIEKLDRCRAELNAADPACKDIKADALADSPAANQSAQLQTSAGQAGTYAQVQTVGTEELLRKYNSAFQAAGEADTKLAAAFIRYAKEMSPSSRDDQVRALSGETSVAAFMKKVEPAGAGYEAMMAAYARYKKLAAQGPQQRYNATSPLHPGEAAVHVRDLQKRLQQEGFYSGHMTGLYDNETQRALKDFQAAHQIDPDGVVGQRTRDWLNVPFLDKADMIAFAMKTVRQSPVRTHDRFIRINIPQFLLEYYKDGKVAETHRVVVGKASGKQVKYQGRMIGENQTPTLSSSIEQVILNPRWYVSDRIRIELNTEAKADPDYFTRHGYVQMASLYPWGQPRIFQRPGPKNALGRVKFEFPNVFAVYLHDTPTKHLFQRSRRDFSHGCIRVDKAVDFATTLLKDDNSSYADKMNSILSGDRQTFVKLAQPVPIAIEYVPVITNSSGHVVFLGDPYGLLKDPSKENVKEGSKDPPKAGNQQKAQETRPKAGV